MKKLLIIILLLPLGLGMAACEKKEDESNKNNYNVIFITPKQNRIYIGTVMGLSSCKYTASTYYSKRRWIGEGWDYVCCLRTADDECKEEQKYEGED